MKQEWYQIRLRCEGESCAIVRGKRDLSAEEVLEEWEADGCPRGDIYPQGTETVSVYRLVDGKWEEMDD